jgi:hypothetical protein
MYYSSPFFLAFSPFLNIPFLVFDIYIFTLTTVIKSAWPCFNLWCDMWWKMFTGTGMRNYVNIYSSVSNTGRVLCGCSVMVNALILGGPVQTRPVPPLLALIEMQWSCRKDPWTASHWSPQYLNDANGQTTYYNIPFMKYFSSTYGRTLDITLRIF